MQHGLAEWSNTPSGDVRFSDATADQYCAVTKSVLSYLRYELGEEETLAVTVHEDHIHEQRKYVS